MAAALQLKAGTRTLVQDGTSLALASGAMVACATATVANATNLDIELNAVLNTGFVVAPVAGAEVAVYLVPQLDGVNFADVDTVTPYPPANCYAGSFWVDLAQTVAQRLTLEGVTVGPYTYKVYLYNRTTQQMAAGWTLDFYGAHRQSTP